MAIELFIPEVHIMYRLLVFQVVIEVWFKQIKFK